MKLIKVFSPTHWAQGATFAFGHQENTTGSRVGTRTSPGDERTDEIMIEDTGKKTGIDVLISGLIRE